MKPGFKNTHINVKPTGAKPIDASVSNTAQCQLYECVELRVELKYDTFARKPRGEHDLFAVDREREASGAGQVLEQKLADPWNLRLLGAHKAAHVGFTNRTTNIKHC